MKFKAESFSLQSMIGLVSAEKHSVYDDERGENKCNQKKKVDRVFFLTCLFIKYSY